MKTVVVSGSLAPNSVDTPLNKRSRIETLADVPNIEAPAVGELFYVRDENKHYKIVSLKSKTVAGVTIPNAQIDRYEELVSVDKEVTPAYSFVEGDSVEDIFDQNAQVEVVETGLPDVSI